MGLLSAIRMALVLVVAFALASCRTVVEQPTYGGDARPGARLTWRGTGRTHGVIAFVVAAPGSRLSIESGTVLVATDSALQRYLVTSSVVVDGTGPVGGVAVRGLCLDAPRRPWPRDGTVTGVALRTAREVAGDRVALFVAMRAVAGPAHARARADARYVVPAMPDADEVVAQWALWRVSDEQTQDDVAEVIARESPALAPDERAEVAASIWAATTVVLEVAGQAVAEEEGLDWAALDLTQK